MTRQNVDLQAELTHNRQQASTEPPTFRQEVRAPQRGSQTSVCTHACLESQATSRVLKARGETGVQCPALLDDALVCKGAALNIVFLARDSEGLSKFGDN